MASTSGSRWWLLLLLRLHLTGARKGKEHADPKAAWPDGASFAGIFTDRAVLQMAPERPALYGVVSDSAGRLSTGLHGDPLRVKIRIEPEERSTKPDTEPEDQREEPQELDAQFVEVVNASYARWKVVLEPHCAGGSYRIAVRCEGCSHPQPHELRDVTFGEVWFCSGQSNMELPMHFTFSRNRTYDAVRHGKYRHIRMYTVSQYALPDAAWPAVDPFIAPQDSEWTLPDAGTYPCDDGRPLKECISKQTLSSDKWINNTLLGFSATCWYFAEALSDLAEARGEKQVPIGLVHSSWGGTMVEMWQPNASLNAQVCRNATGGPYQPLDPNLKPAGSLWNGMVLPFVNMTIKGVLWYQGENNIHQCAGDARTSKPGEVAVCGNATAGTGYGCFFKQLMASWREAWSSGPLSQGTTSPRLPFGVVSLAARTSEGNSANMGAFRLAQTGGTGFLPSAAWPDTFVAQAYDLGDPGGHPKPHTDANWMDGAGAYFTSRGVAPFTTYFMGEIHPRVKRPVGHRLAQAARALVHGDSATAYTGPVARSCQISRGALSIGFDASLLPGDVVAVRQAALVGALPLGKLARVAPQAVLELLAQASDDDLYTSPLEVQYDGTGFADGVWLSASLHPQCPGGGLSNSKDGGVLGNEACGIDDGTGKPNPDFHFASAALPLGTVNTSRITGVRYAFRDDPCCPGINRGTVPCPPGSCPIQGYNSTLPAVPFIAKVEGGKCTWISTQEGAGSASTVGSVAAPTTAAGDELRSWEQVLV